MQTLRYILIFALCFSVILAACAPAAPTSSSVLPTSSSLPQPTLLPTTPIPASESISVSAPVIEYATDGSSKLLVISSVTGKTFDAFAPIILGDNYSYAFAQDGHTLALVSNGQLYLIDLPSWKYRTFDVGLHGWLSSVVYSSDGALLALASDGADGVLRVVDPMSGEVKASAPAGFSIRSIKFTVDGKSLMVFGPHLASTGVAANAGVSVGAPKVALYNASDLSVLWSVELDGIRYGTFPKKADTANTQEIYQPGAAWHYEPGAVFDPNREMLYIVHGDEDKLTKVDFANRKVSTVDIHVKTSWLDPLMALTAGVAYAKGMDGTIKQVVISPDGKFLFVGGTTEAVTQQADGINWDITDTPIGLQVIAVENGTFVADIDTEATPTRLSPDGRQIFLTGWKNNGSYATQWTDVYDISSRSLVKHIDNVDLMPTRRIDGKLILVSNEYIGNNGDNECYLASVDPATWTITNRWKGDCVGWLIIP